MNQKQDNIIRISKGLCIIFVVLGHTMIPSIRNANGTIYSIWTVIYLFHMPVFFAISGILYELNCSRYEKNPWSFIKGKFELLIIPYLFISTISYIGLAIMKKIPLISELIDRYVHDFSGVKSVLYEILTYENHVAQHLWFVLVLFLIFLTNILLRKTNQLFLCVSLLVLPIFVLPILKARFSVPDIPNYFLFELPFFMFGRLIGRNKKVLTTATKGNVSPLIFAILTYIYISYFDSYENFGGPIRWIYLFVTRCTGILMIFSVASWLEKNAKIKEICKYLEQKSYVIYLLHQPFIVSGIAGVLVAVGIPNTIIIFVVTVIGITVPLLIDKWMKDNKWYQELILGGRNKKKEGTGT